MVPCFNEELALPSFYEEAKKIMDDGLDYDWELLFINDGSRDDTLKIICGLYEKDDCISYIDLSRNFGKERAMMAGFDFVKGDCC